MKRVLVTGAAGLVGSNLVQYLTEHGCRVCGVDNLSGGNFIIHGDRVEFHKCDVESDYFIRIFKQFNPDVVYHCAAYAAEGLSPFIRKFNYKNNLVATANVVNCCIQYGVDRLVFFSSMAVYGNRYYPPFDEELTPTPIDPYGVAKYACEMDIQIAGEQHGLDWCIIRPHNIYGRNQNIWDQYRNVLGIWMRKHLDGEPLTIFGDGTQRRAFSFIDDCLLSMYLAGESPLASKQIINLGGTKSVTIEEAADTLIDVMGGGEKLFLEGRHETKLAFSTWDKSVELLSYGTEDNPETSLHAGLTDMWEYAKTATRGIAKVWDTYEVDRGIYNFWKK